MEKESSWKHVVPRRKNNSRHNFRVRAVKHYWQGFNLDGNQNWFVELNDGRILTKTHNEYNFWVKRFYPNRKVR